MIIDKPFCSLSVEHYWLSDPADVVFELKGRWTHEFLSGQSGVTEAFATPGGSPFAVQAQLVATRSS